MRDKLTKGNIEFLNELIQAYTAHLQHEMDPSRRKSISGEVNKFNAIRTTFHSFDKLGQILPSSKEEKLEKDESAYMTVEGGWQKIAIEDMARNFGRYGPDAISGLSELLLYSNALARAFGTDNLYYRGEHKYGYKLQSRAERKIPYEEGKVPGITSIEIEELRRFQDEFKSNLPYDFPNSDDLPDDNDPRWLPIMQHYDEKFGTRLLDITSSPFAGLYFACVSWHGTIDTKHDGLIYAFLPGGNMPIRGDYYDERPEKFDEEMDEISVNNVEDSFKEWKAPSTLRLYKSSTLSPRELAQDGSFLLKGALTDEYGFGQGFKFRVPSELKTRIAKELWVAGYTPKRIVRGPIGIEAHNNLGKLLRIRHI